MTNARNTITRTLRNATLMALALDAAIVAGNPGQVHAWNGPGNPPNKAVYISPANNATGECYDSFLSWNVANGADTYDVLMWDDVPDFGPGGDPPVDEIYGITDTFLDLSSYTTNDFGPGASLWWQVVAVNSSGSTAGAVWSFTLKPPATAATLDSPINNATGVSIDEDLAWTAGANTGSFDVLLDTVTPPVSQVASKITATTLDVGQLLPSTTYYCRVNSYDVCEMEYASSAIQSFTTGAAYTLTTATTGNGGGSIDPAPGAYLFDTGTNVTLTAASYFGSRFTHWDIDGNTTSGAEFFDDFSVSDGLSGWSTSGSWSETNGYAVNTDTSGWNNLYQDRTHGDSEIEYTYQLSDVNASTYRAQLVCRYTPGGDGMWIIFYAATAKLQEMVGGSWVYLHSVPLTSTEGIDYDVRVEMNGKNIEVFRDETKVLWTTPTTEASTLEGTRVLFQVPTGCTTRYDDIGLTPTTEISKVTMSANHDVTAHYEWETPDLSGTGMSLLDDFDALDVDASDGLDFTETQDATDAPSQVVFDAIDLDSDGELTVFELEEARWTSNYDMTITLTIDGLDTDGNGIDTGHVTVSPSSNPSLPPGVYLLGESVTLEAAEINGDGDYFQHWENPDMTHWKTGYAQTAKFYPDKKLEIMAVGDITLTPIYQVVSSATFSGLYANDTITVTEVGAAPGEETCTITPAVDGNGIHSVTVTGPPDTLIQIDGNPVAGDPYWELGDEDEQGLTDPFTVKLDGQVMDMYRDSLANRPSISVSASTRMMSGTGGGTVHGPLGAYSCGIIDGSVTAWGASYGTDVFFGVFAGADIGTAFHHWNLPGGGTSTQADYHQTTSEDWSGEAVFEQMCEVSVYSQYPGWGDVYVSIGGGPEFTVPSSEEGEPPAFHGFFPNGTQVTLRAEDDHFGKWVGDLGGEELTKTFTLAKNPTMVAGKFKGRKVDVVMTFDDGPHGTSSKSISKTWKTVEALGEHKPSIKGHFFIVTDAEGRTKGAEDIVKEMHGIGHRFEIHVPTYDEGHPGTFGYYNDLVAIVPGNPAFRRYDTASASEIANFSMNTLPDPSPPTGGYTGTNLLETSLRRAKARINHLCGYTPKFARGPEFRDTEANVKTVVESLGLNLSSNHTGVKPQYRVNVDPKHLSTNSTAKVAGNLMARIYGEVPAGTSTFVPGKLMETPPAERLVILFHDIQVESKEEMKAYIEAIVQACRSARHIEYWTLFK